MDQNNLPMLVQPVELVVPAFQDREQMTLHFGNIKEGERRLIEARVVTPSTYSDLSYSFNEGYREARTNITAIGYEIVQAEKILRRIKSELILDEYPAFLKTSSMKDNSTLRDAFLEKNPGMIAAQDRLSMLKAMQALMEDKVKIFENVCKYMKVQMDLAKNGNFNSNKY
jgi:hypothetical protein